MESITSFLVSLHPVNSALLKMTFLLFLVCLIQMLIKDKNPRLRILLWRWSAVGILIVPFISTALPIFEIQVEPLSTESTSLLLDGELTLNECFSQDQLQSNDKDTSYSFLSIESSGHLLSTQNKGSILPTLTEDKLNSQPPSISNPYPIIIVAWLFGFIIIKLISIQSERRISMIVRNSYAAPEKLNDMLKQMLDGFVEIKKSPQLRVSPITTSPFLVGVRNPIIVIPSNMIEEMKKNDLPAIFSHELNHLVGKDLFWFRVFNTIAFLLWWHPLVWLTRHEHISACEELADALAAESIGDSESYSRTLARIALSTINLPSTTSTAPMAQNPKIIRRLNQLKSKAVTSRLQTFIVVTTFTMGIACLFAVSGFRLVYANEAQNEEGISKPLVLQDQSSKKCTDQRPNDHNTFVVEPNGLLTVKVDNVDLVITTGDEPQVIVDVLCMTQKDTKTVDTDLLEHCTPNFHYDGKNLGITRMQNNYEKSSKNESYFIKYLIQIPEEYNVDLSISSGSITMENSTGEVNINSNLGNVQLSQVSGNITAKCDRGDIHLQEIKGNINAFVSRGNLSLQNIDGDVEVSCSRGNVILHDIIGEVNALVERGNLISTITKNINEDLNLVTNRGNITVNFPKDLNLNIDANSVRGSVTTQFNQNEADHGILKKNPRNIKYRSILKEDEPVLSASIQRGHISLNHSK